MIDACRREVLGLHAFLSAWFTGQLDDTDASFSRIADALAPGFVFINPGGYEQHRESLLGSIRRDHGREKVFAIEIRHFRAQHTEDDLAVVVYEEHQRTGKDANARISTAVFGRSGSAPEGVTWLHLHETALPSG